jgi:hypothetical protein
MTMNRLGLIGYGLAYAISIVGAPLVLEGCADKVAYRGKSIGSIPPNIELSRDSKSVAEVTAALKASKDPYLKCHLWDGSVIVLEDYRVESEHVLGKGIRYDSTRNPVERASFRLAIKDVALFETNRPESVASARVPIMATVGLTSAALTALCITVPKACFGSCPTIYAPSEQGMTLQAEGFSSSIAKILEATDVDALSAVPARWSERKLEVRNEAPETHSIRSLVLLAAPRPSRGQVYRSGAHYYATISLTSPVSCQSDDGDCLAAVKTADGSEYKSDTDGQDLTHQETLELVFPATATATKSLGLVLTARNSLLNSYLFYQALAYMGADAGQYLALLERGRLPALSGSRKIGDLLGGIDVSVASEGGRWLPAGQYFEVGPLARETELFLLPEHLATPLRIRLTMSRGNMRLENVALTQVLGEVVPERLEPIRVTREGIEDGQALAELRDPDRYLVTYPGDAYEIHYPPPSCDECAWFVESRGYYYEWMREVWLPEQDPAKLMKLLFSPEEALKELAPDYRRIEPTIDRYFWQSPVETRRPKAPTKP